MSTAFDFDPIEFDALPINEQGVFAPLPDGWYKCDLSGAEVKKTKAGDGSYFNLKFKVLGPTHAGRVLFAMITHKNKNETAERIGGGQLRDLMSACGIKTLSDTDQLLGNIVEIKVGSREYQGELTNEVKAYRSINGVVPTSPSTVKPDIDAPKKSAPPWARPK